MLKVVHEENESHEKGTGCGGSLLDQVVRDGARQLLAVALQAEVAAYIEAHAHERDEAGRRLVVRNGFHEPREVTTAAGAVPVRAPRVNDRRVDEVSGQRVRFSSAILPAWARKSPQVAEVLPLLYLHGLSSLDFAPALTQFLGTGHGLSPTTITRLTKAWQDEARAFNQRSLAEVDYVYVWVDGIHLKVRLEQDKVCLLVMIGVRADGTKELIALDDGHRESTESWADLLRSCQRRGMRAPVLAVGDGALGFWAAVRQVFPGTREQRCWFHKIANVLNCLPKSAQPGAKAALAEIWNAEDREHAAAAARAFAAQYGVKWPKAAAKIIDDLDVLLAFFDFPAEHWVHLRTTNPIESTFATVRLRQRVTKGPGSRAAGVAMAFKLIQAAQARWRAVNAPHLVALVRAGATFERGILVERPEDTSLESGGDQQVA
ncbi:IS256 family transposase [Ornithinibacter aureus]|uniref:IS256 family transposase n=2 Tax=Ornithinibacter aureus TaxID=622664 RepID=UPI00135C02B1|nr:IS256 family transposase [Ornithinibacter aureus]KAF0833870.1 transposase-like protein [Ornithinibacter aureus]KAF0833970.1 transposase-like protein [Ornithinibacter aureus]KAF0835265.1 transposase-like protein [Ornithinibacter aureus]KAF0835384.1 transposase-like protein [Ornithinibacter aureus]